MWVCHHPQGSLVCSHQWRGGGPLRPSRQRLEHTWALRERNLQAARWRGCHGTVASRGCKGLHQSFAPVSRAPSPEICWVSKTRPGGPCGQEGGGGQLSRMECAECRVGTWLLPMACPSPTYFSGTFSLSVFSLVNGGQWWVWEGM